MNSAEYIDKLRKERDAARKAWATERLTRERTDDEVLRLQAHVRARDTDLAAQLATIRQLEAKLAEYDGAIEDPAAMMWTLTGRMHPLAAKPEEIRIRDVARGLATKFRYNGHTIAPYTVAEHSVIVSLYVAPEHARQALLHDATEAYIGDMIRPIKYRPVMRGYRDVEARLELVIFRRFGIVPTEESYRAVKAIDDRILVDEIGQLISDLAAPDMDAIRAKYGEPLGAAIPCLAPRDAEYLFCSRFAELFPEELAA